jgi:hypothetical protein
MDFSMKPEPHEAQSQLEATAADSQRGGDMGLSDPYIDAQLGIGHCDSDELHRLDPYRRALERQQKLFRRDYDLVKENLANNSSLAN